MSYISSISNHGMTNYYGKIASGKAIQSAADGAAELAITQGQTAQIKGYDMATQSMQSGKNVLNITDSALGKLTEQLHRMKELAIQASNGILTDSDKMSIQEEITQLKQGINSIAKNTEFNTKKLLDGSNSQMQIPTDGNGHFTSLSTGNATLDTLGLSDFDVTKDFDLQAIDDALSTVNSMRGEIGGKSNALDFAINQNSTAIENLTRAKNALEELDLPKILSEQKKEEALQLYEMMMLRKQQEQAEKSISTLLG